MKKVLLTIFLFSSLYGTNDALKLGVIKVLGDRVKETVHKVIALKQIMSRYIYETGKENFTKAEINTRFGAKVSWMNYGNVKELDYTINNDIITFQDVLGSSDVALITFAKKYIDFEVLLRNDFGTVSYDRIGGTMSISIPLNERALAILKIIRKVKEHSPKIIINEDNPTQSGFLLYYRPNGDGTFRVYSSINKDGKWLTRGVLGTKNMLFENGYSRCLDTFESKSILKEVVAFENTCASVFEKGILRQYFYVQDAHKWFLESAEAQSKEVNTILQIATGTKPNAFARAINNEFEGTVNFVLKGNYWLGSYASTELFIGTNISVANNHRILGSYVYIPDSSKTNILVLKKMNVPTTPNSKELFVYIANGYDDVIKRFSNVQSNGEHGSIIYDKKNDTFFKLDGTIFKSLNGAVEITGDSGGRNTFSSTKPGVLYYTTINDCSKYNCYGYGTDINNNFSGVKKDGLYLFVYSSSRKGNRKQHLVDGQYVNSFKDMYNKKFMVAVYKSQTYFKIASINTFGENSIAYMFLDPPYFQVIAPDGFKVDSLFADFAINTQSTAIFATVNLPGRTSMATPNLFYDSKTLNDMSYFEIASFTNAKNRVQAKLAGSNYRVLTHIKGNGLDYWTDNATGDHQENASIIVTSGSRSSFPQINHNIIAISLQLGDDDTHTAGIRFNQDNNFYRWWYSSDVSTMVTNGLTDKPSSDKGLSENHKLKWDKVHYTIETYQDALEECSYKGLLWRLPLKEEFEGSSPVAILKDTPFWTSTYIYDERNPKNENKAFIVKADDTGAPVFKIVNRKSVAYDADTDVYIYAFRCVKSKDDSVPKEDDKYIIIK
jgi:hypothetical protein